MNKIQKISTVLIAIFNAILIGSPSINIAFWAFIDSAFVKRFFNEGNHGWFVSSNFYTSIITPDGPINLYDVKWTFLSKLLGMLSCIISLFPVLVGVFFLRQIFKNYRRNEVFTRANACYYRYIGWLFFLNAFIIQPIVGGMLEFAATMNNAPGHRSISISFGSPNLEAIFCGAILIVISWVMGEASKLQDDQKFTI